MKIEPVSTIRNAQKVQPRPCEQPAKGCTGGKIVNSLFSGTSPDWLRVVSGAGIVQLGLYRRYGEWDA